MRGGLSFGPAPAIIESMDKDNDGPVPSAAEPAKSWLGSMEGTGRILGDIVKPATEECEWDALRD